MKNAISVRQANGARHDDDLFRRHGPTGRRLAGILLVCAVVGCSSDVDERPAGVVETTDPSAPVAQSDVSRGLQAEPPRVGSDPVPPSTVPASEHGNTAAAAADTKEGAAVDVPYSRLAEAGRDTQSAVGDAVSGAVSAVSGVVGGVVGAVAGDEGAHTGQAGSVDTIKGPARDKIADKIKDANSREAHAEWGNRAQALSNAPITEARTHADGDDVHRAAAAGLATEGVREDRSGRLTIPFGLSKEAVPAEAMPVLDALVREAGASPSRQWRIIGHADARGDAAFNLQLSQQRATAIANYLIAKGVAASRLAVSGVGATHPLENAMPDATQWRNRRVDIERLD